MVGKGNARPCFRRMDLGQDAKLPAQPVKLPDTEPNQEKDEQGGQESGEDQPPPAPPGSRPCGRGARLSRR
jgi:hypothetical protein